MSLIRKWIDELLYIHTMKYAGENNGLNKRGWLRGIVTNSISREFFEKQVAEEY